MKSSKFSDNPYVTPVNVAIVIVNIIIFLIYEILGSTLDAAFMLQHGAMYPQAIYFRGEWYRLLTSAFLHFGMAHLLNNMVMLVALGSYMEKALGSVKYAILYVLCAIGANILSAYWNLSTGQMAISAGASGAVFGVMGALLYLVVRYRGRYENLTMKRFLIMVGLSLYYGFSSTGVDNAAHLGGLAVGFVLCVLLYHKRCDKI